MGLHLSDDLVFLGAMGEPQAPTEELVQELTLSIPPVTSAADDFGAETIQDRLLRSGWRSTVIPRGVRTRSKSLEILRLRRILGRDPQTGREAYAPFAPSDAEKAVRAAANAAGTKLAALKAWGIKAVRVAEFVAEVPATALSEKGRRQTAEVIEKGSSAVTKTVLNPFCAAIKGATGLSCRTVVIGGVAVAATIFLWPTISPFLAAGARRVARRVG